MDTTMAEEEAPAGAPAALPDALGRLAVPRCLEWAGGRRGAAAAHDAGGGAAGSGAADTLRHAPTSPALSHAHSRTRAAAHMRALARKHNAAQRRAEMTRVRDRW